MKPNLKTLGEHFESIIPRGAEEAKLTNDQISQFWRFFDDLVNAIRQRYLEKIPEETSSSAETLVKAMYVGRISALEEVLGADKV